MTACCRERASSGYRLRIKRRGSQLKETCERIDWRNSPIVRNRRDPEAHRRACNRVTPGLLRQPHQLRRADSLEREWNEKLTFLAQAEQEYTHAAKSAGSDLSAQSKDRILVLASDLPVVWNNPRTPSRERKRLLRLLVEDVTLVRDRAIKLHIRWKGGATTSCERPLPLGAPDLRRTPADIVEQVRALATEQTDRQIAQTLNGRWLRSGTGKPFTPARVRFVRITYNIDSLAQNLRRAGWLTCEEIAKELHVHPCTAKRFASQGVLRAVRADGKGLVLFKPPTGPLPRAHPGKRFRDRRRYPQLAAHVRREMQYEA